MIGILIANGWERNPLIKIIILKLAFIESHFALSYFLIFSIVMKSEILW